MAHGKNAEKNGHHYEFHSRRPFGYLYDKSPENKRMTCRHERRVIHKRELRELLAIAFAGYGEHLDLHAGEKA